MKIRNDVTLCPFCGYLIDVDTSFSEFLASQPIPEEVKETISNKWKMLEIISGLLVLGGFGIFAFNITEGGMNDAIIQLGLGMMAIGFVTLGFDQFMVWWNHRKNKI